MQDRETWEQHKDTCEAVLELQRIQMEDAAKSLEEKKKKVEIEINDARKALDEERKKFEKEKANWEKEKEEAERHFEKWMKEQDVRKIQKQNWADDRHREVEFCKMQKTKIVETMMGQVYSIEINDDSLEILGALARHIAAVSVIPEKLSYTAMLAFVSAVAKQWRESKSEKNNNDRTTITFKTHGAQRADQKRCPGYHWFRELSCVIVFEISVYGDYIHQNCEIQIPFDIPSEDSIN